MPSKEADLIKQICVQSGMLLECIQWNEEEIEKDKIRNELKKLTELIKQLEKLV